VKLRSLLCILLWLGLLIAACSAAYSGPVFSAGLNPVNGSTGSGFGSIQVSDDLLTAFVQIIFSGLTGDATAAGFSGAISFSLLGVPFATSGSPSGTFSISPGDVLALESGGGSFRVSSTEFPGGELFGSLPEGDIGGAPGGGPPPIAFPPPVVPEPSTLILVLAGIGMLLVQARWTRRSASHERP